MSDLERRAPRPRAAQREQRAYRLVQAGGAAGVVAVDRARARDPRRDRLGRPWSSPPCWRCSAPCCSAARSGGRLRAGGAAAPHLLTGPPRGPASRGRRGSESSAAVQSLVIRAPGGRRGSVGPPPPLSPEEDPMTESKHLKARIRARMAHTGERYMTARRHVVGERPAAPADDHGWQLRGGLHPDSAAIANVLAHHGTEVSEALVLGVGGGLGAGYILWEFEAHRHAHARARLPQPVAVPGPLGRQDARAPRRAVRAARDRRREGRRGEARRRARRRAPGARHRRPAGDRPLAPARARLGPRRLPGRGARLRRRPDADRRPQPRAAHRRARAPRRRARPRRLLQAPARGARAGRDHAPSTLRAAVRAGLADAVEHLGARSDSFGLPAWRKWARMLTDTRNAKAWPNVFADRARARRRAALHLRGHRAGRRLRRPPARPLRRLPRRGGRAARGARGWPRPPRRLPRRRARCGTSSPSWRCRRTCPEFAALREELAAVHESVVARGDAGREEAAQAAARLWELRARLDAAPPVEPDFARLGAAVRGDLRGRGGGRGAAHGLRRSLRQPSPSRR